MENNKITLYGDVVKAPIKQQEKEKEEAKEDTPKERAKPA